MIKKLLGPAFALAAVFAVPAHAETVTVNPNGSWYGFDVDDTVSESGGLEWINLIGEALSFTFTTPTATRLTVVDAGFGGDAFEIFDNGASLGFTSSGAATVSGQRRPELRHRARRRPCTASASTRWRQAHTITGRLLGLRGQRVR